MTCPHDSDEMWKATDAGMCPLCQQAETARLRAALADMISLCRHKASNREEELRVEAAWFTLKDTTP